MRRLVVQVELHRGRLPRMSVKTAPRDGDIVWNGDVLCVLERCYPCGEGFMARELEPRVDRHRRRHRVRTLIGTS